MGRMAVAILVLLSNNIDNISQFYGRDRVRIELVAYGDGVTAFVRDGSPVRARVDAAKTEGVRLVACRISLAAHDRGVADLISGVDWVPSGLPEIVERELAGWVYLRP
ncbi:MAG TPA: DsrE family protein [Stellaceae bacterium]|nr:DsrE family protein [Stellaceae bacterium]